VVVGSALVKLIEKYSRTDKLFEEVKNFARSLKSELEKSRSYQKSFPYQPPPAVSEAQYLRSESWRLAWPVFLGQGGNQVMILLSRMMVGHLGEGSLAGVGIGQMIFFALVVGLSAVGIGVVALVARQIGAGDREE